MHFGHYQWSRYLKANLQQLFLSFSVSCGDFGTYEIVQYRLNVGMVQFNGFLIFTFVVFAHCEIC